MPLKSSLARVAHRIETAIDLVRRSPTVAEPVIDCYGGYTTPDRIVLRGRVLARDIKISRAGTQSRWRNFLDFLKLFSTDELSGVTIEVIDRAGQTQTDEEGFFKLSLPRQEGPVPDQLMVRAKGATLTYNMPIYRSDEAPFGVISDIDDTILRTGAYSLVRNLWTSATGNVHQREVFEDAIALLGAFRRRGGCFFYVSSSPWNLFEFLQSIFRRTDLPPGPFFLRDLGISRTQFITGTHGDHKTNAIETILGANPGLTFILIGDTGQHDPHIYATIVRNHPGRVARVILRQPTSRALSAEVKRDLNAIEAAGVSLAVARDYTSLLSPPGGPPA